ncbi:MAG: hypothetical protein U5L96_01960 [Owenweeksia sp.]|nr:hypothetical protein [Owenweeksia sp.]
MEDNWRRSQKNPSANFNQNDQGAEDDGDLQADGSEADNPQEEGNKLDEYLANIPDGETEKEAAHEKIRTAYLNIGQIYRNELEDIVAAERILKELLERYPDMAERGRVWYILYRINNTASDTVEAEYYKNLILKELPESKYAELINGVAPQDETENKEALAYYKKTYKTYKEGNYRQVIRRSDSGLTAFASSAQAPQFMLLKAYAQGGLQDAANMERTLNALIAQHGGTEQATEAQNILNHIGQEPVAGETGKGGQGVAGNSKFPVDESEEHKYLLIVPNSRGLVNNVTIDIIDFNDKFFKNLNLNTKPVYISAEEQMVLVSGLPNRQKAIQYFKLLKQQNVLAKNLTAKEIKHFVISNSNFTEVYQEKSFSAYLDFFKDNYL